MVTTTSPDGTFTTTRSFYVVTTVQRLLSLVMAVVMLSALSFTPTRVELVCQISGEAMPPVVASAETEESCCTIAATVGADGATHYKLIRQGCCDLVITQGTDHPPATTSDTGWSVAVALAPEVAPVPVPMWHEVYLMPLPLREVAPRGPPLLAHPARAPPFFS